MKIRVQKCGPTRYQVQQFEEGWGEGNYWDNIGPEFTEENPAREFAEKLDTDHNHPEKWETILELGE